MNPLVAASIVTPGVDWLGVAPVALLALAAIGIVLQRSILRRASVAYPSALVVAAVGIILSAIALTAQWKRVQTDGSYTTLSNMVAVDGFSIFIGGVVLFATACSVLLASRYLDRERLDGPEYLALMLLSASGMLAMSSSNDLIAIFVALEIVSIPLYLSLIHI